MSSPRRQCEIKVPEALVERLELEPGGIQPILHRIQKDFGLSTSSSYVGAKNYFIIGPNPEILELALETLQTRYFHKEEKQSNVSGQIVDKQAIWRLQGDYGAKAAHLYQPELEDLRRMPSVTVHISPLCIEVTCSYDSVEEVKSRVDKLQADIDALYEEDISVRGACAHIPTLKRFIRRKHKHDKTVVCIWDEKLKKVTVYGKTEVSVKKLVDEWAMMRDFGGSPLSWAVASPTVSPRASPTLDRRYRNELKIPGGIVEKLERQSVGIYQIINSVQKEFGLKVSYVRNKHMTVLGPHIDILELAAQTLVHRYVLKTPPENGVLGQLRGRNAVWKFLGNYAKKLGHLFTRELRRLERMKTVALKFTPSRVNPSSVEVLCSARMIEDVKVEVERMVGMVHSLFEKEIVVANDPEQIRRVKDFIREMTEIDKTILCLFDEGSRKLTVYGRNEGSVWNAIAHVQEQRRQDAARHMLPKEYWHSHRQLYQTQISDQLVQKLLEIPGGIIPIIQRIEREYEVKALYHRNNNLVLISPSADVLELTHDTLENRYIGRSRKGSRTKKTVTFAKFIPGNSPS